MKIEDNLASFKNKIDPLIKKYLEEKIHRYQKTFPGMEALTSQIKDLTLRGGDRIRPALFNSGFKLIRQPNTLEEKELLRLSTAFELLHSFALIHDDIIDDGFLRRGGKTVHQYFAGCFGHDWGDKLAILSGDLAEIFSQEIFRSLLFPQKIDQARELFIRMKEETIVGEYVDTVLPLIPGFPSEAIVRSTLCYKSGFYSVQKPLLIGAVLAGANDNQYRTLSKVGEYLGLAFQIKDDILGLFGKEKITGKSVVSDICEGKKTLLVIKTWENMVGEKDKKMLLGLLGKKDISPKEINWIKKMMRDTGALDYCLRESAQLVVKAKTLIEKEQFRPKEKLFLSALADFIILRQY